ncbi:hypothetical protein GJW-30_1_01295 [Variibacter gotjawalensis]|uniref:DUF983 domain-containing protein n=1 Tax=Variibacter gotjawalensis TaxID=1333996 RepID=A0A0S3PSD9_9BRAD|nr:DUF983 domain-containing protein [Variibacter gotjawalensis]NIK49078.1 uncharacterized protein (DUF983 family) [Variibacter gotjawalensis]RZS50934.1 uncharacterized protein (DUF983 family) [Variibacter gotjawalensis]BAT58768.1 hypothetical protein GJW-30_1_01295 [Variibacter gotjawalensis]
MEYPVPSTTTAAFRGLAGRCPRCGEGKLFAGFATLKPSCETCGLDFSFADAGDGPIVFVILIAGAILAAAALITEVKYAPALWVHAVLWGPLAVVVCVGPLRPLKGLLIALQYHFQAREGRLTDRDAP